MAKEGKDTFEELLRLIAKYPGVFQGDDDLNTDVSAKTSIAGYTIPYFH